MTQLSNVRVTDEQLAVWKAEAKRVMHHPATPMDIHCHAYATYVLATELQERRSATEAQKPYGYVHKSVYEDVGSEALTNDHEAYRDSRTHIPLYAAPQPAAGPDDDKTNMLCDSAYVNGLQAGFSMGQMNQEAEYAQTVEHYRKGIREYRAAMLNAEPVSQPYTLPDGLPPMEHLDIIKFNADCAMENPDSIYANEFFLSLDEIFGEKGNYSLPVQAKAISVLIAEIFRIHGYKSAPQEPTK